MKTKKNSAEVANVNHSTLAQPLIRDRLGSISVFMQLKNMNRISLYLGKDLCPQNIVSVQEKC